MENKDSILFWELTRILELVKRAAGSTISVKHIVENGMMDKEPESIISEHLGDRATKISASPVCAAARDRLFWFDFELQPFEDETLNKGHVRNELILEPNPESIDFWDEGWVQQIYSMEPCQPSRDGRHGTCSRKTHEESTYAPKRP